MGRMALSWRLAHCCLGKRDGSWQFQRFPAGADERGGAERFGGFRERVPPMQPLTEYGRIHQAESRGTVITLKVVVVDGLHAFLFHK
jgi:hypothetical protein